MRKPTNTDVTTPFGYVDGYPLNNGFHNGVDFSFQPDERIYMPERGTVTIGPKNSVDGNNMIVRGSDGRVHGMYHIQDGGFLVGNGTYDEGTPIAIMGDTGAAQGRHLHWVLRINGELVNGMDYITEGGNQMEPLNEGDIRNVGNADGWNLSDAYVQAWIGKDWKSFWYDYIAQPERQVHLKEKYGTVAPAPATPTCTKDERAYLDSMYKVVKKF